MRIVYLFLISLGLFACATPEPEVVNFNGVPAKRINTIVMGNEYPPSEEDNLLAAKEAKSGTKFNRLPAQANKQCPNGYDILDEGELTYKPYLVPAAGKHYARYRQSFIIACR